MQSEGWWAKDRSSYTKVYWNETLITKFVKLSFPNNADIYFDNLCSLGLLQRVDYYHVQLDTHFEQISARFRKC